MLIELKDSWQPILSFFELVEAFEVLGKVVKDQVLFEDGDDVPLLVIHYVRCYLRIVILLGGQVLGIERFLSHESVEILLNVVDEKDLLCAHGAEPVDPLR